MKYIKRAQKWWAVDWFTLSFQSQSSTKRIFKVKVLVLEKWFWMRSNCETYSTNNALFCSVRDVMNGLQCKSRKKRKILSEFFFFFLILGDLQRKPFKCYINGLQCKSFENKKKSEIFLFILDDLHCKPCV